MKKILAFILIFIGLCACSHRMVESSSSNNQLKEQLSKWMHEREVYNRHIEILRDSLIRMKAPQEHSSVVADSFARAGTSLAEAWAAIIAGKLHLDIKNKDSIDALLRQHYIHDSIFIRDTLRITDTLRVEIEKEGKTVVEKKRFLEDFFYYSGWALSCLILIYTTFKLYLKKR